MKKVFVYLIILSLVLLSSCLNILNDDIPTWLKNKIIIADKGCDATSTYAIYEYNYNKNTVYYFDSYFEHDYNCVYNENGNLLGAPDGGPDNSGDGELIEFFAKSQNNGLVWHEDDEMSLSDEYDYWFFNNMLNLNFFTSKILLQRETMFPNYYQEILDTLRTHHVEAHYMTVASYNVKNNEAHELIDSLFQEPIECISKAYIDSVLDSSGWEGFAALNSEFPGYCEFALPAYDPVDSVGLFVFAFHFGEDKRYWRITLGEIVNDEWQLMQNDSTGEYYAFDNEAVFYKSANQKITPSKILKSPFKDIIEQ